MSSLNVLSTNVNRLNVEYKYRFTTVNAIVIYRGNIYNSRVKDELSSYALDFGAWFEKVAKDICNCRRKVSFNIKVIHLFLNAACEMRLRYLRRKSYF